MRFKSLTLSILVVSSTILGLPLSSHSETGSDSGNSKKFAALTEEFIHQSLARSPSTASQVGYHTHVDAGKTIELDALLDDMSLEFMNEQRHFYQKYRERFAKETPKSSLSANDAADWQLLDDQIALALLDLDTIKNYQHNPTVVVELIGSALFQPLTASYADKEKRIEHVLERVGQIPRLLDQVKKYLDKADSIYVKTAIEENEGNIELIESTLLQEIPQGSKLKITYDNVTPQAVTALKEFNNWLSTELSNCPNPRSWRLGKDWYDAKFKLVLETAVTPEELLSNAESTLTSVRGDMLKMAIPMHAKMYPDHDEHNDKNGVERENLIIKEVLQKVSDDHPDRDSLLKAVERDLDGIKQFIRDKKIVTLSERDNLKVIPTPPFMRGIYSVAGFHSAPPLEPQAEAQYWVTPIDSKVSAEKAESKLREYNNYTLKWLTIHEALPGHYIQFEHVNNIQPERRRLLRSLYSNGAYVEGWAEYIAQVMMDEGFMKDDPRFAFIMKKIRLRLLANTILDVRMHTMNMTDEEAMDLMVNRTFQTQAEAEGKLKRAKLSSTQLPTYYAGLLEWLTFRKKYQEAKGKSFDLLEFHNRALDEGPLPVPLVSELLLK